MKPRYWQLSYDISDPKRRYRAAKRILVYGERVQKSLYLCPLTPEQRDLLHGRLADIIEPPDRLMMRPICRHCRSRIRYQGAGGRPERHEPFWII
ncbi:MAG: CRISPR-associated endonuclease Cas2 [Gammaproteobacteria bacterium]|nr:CRISPR-associated endonuclease Cas2 [Gammaproteobacteria bacterium]MBU1654096.1 CRISPR-associated endonuclease Cas2 [Gammaproteobacteria bacterium]MBU1961377.1 CRISPR-associated endonuclease Cas2 [Gammaproteobacteria bacterium]